MSDMMYFGGVEGGATHSNLVICDGNGKAVGRAKGPGTNHWTLGKEECARRIISMLNEAIDDAAIPPGKTLDSLGLTLSGCEQESSNEELAQIIRERSRISSVYVASDTAGSLFTGAPNGGLVLIAGTGSNTLLRTPEGKHYGCGGWGHLLGDEGSAYWIAHKAVKTIFDDDDGLRDSTHPTHLVWETIREHFSCETKADLLPHAYQHFEKSAFAGLTLKLAHLANKGDALSQHIFGLAGAALAASVIALCKRSNSDAVRVVCVGSVWKSWDLLKSGFLKELANRHATTDLELVRLRVSSAMGAAWLAAQHVGYDLPRDDAAHCEVFYKYSGLTTVNGRANGDTNGLDGSQGCGCNDWSNWS